MWLPSYAFDTFEGFTAADVELEASARGKNRYNCMTSFSINHQKTFDEAMRRNGCRSASPRGVLMLTVIRFPNCAAVPFALVDVDLYRPVLSALTSIYPLCVPGGIIVVDDCRETRHAYDGAAQAYHEFITIHRIAPRIVCGKLGVIEVPVKVMEGRDRD